MNAEAKKIAKELQQLRTDGRVRVTLNLDEKAYLSLQKRYPRHAKPSVSDVISRLIEGYLQGLK